MGGDKSERGRRGSGRRVGGREGGRRGGDKGEKGLWELDLKIGLMGG